MNKIDSPYYILNFCRGFAPQGCRFNVVEDKGLVDQVVSHIEGSDWKKSMGSKVNGPLKAHEKLKISFAGCPNGCSRPHIHDLGVIGAVRPQVVEENCVNCGICSEVCKEQAISSLKDVVQIDYTPCLYCGECVRACPDEAMAVSKAGFRMVVGGRLGRHPRLAKDLRRVFYKEQVISTLDSLFKLHEEAVNQGKRLSFLIEQNELDIA